MPEDEIDDILGEYEPDGLAEALDDAGQPTGKAVERISPINEPIQADVMDASFAQGPAGGRAPAKKKMSKAMSALGLRIQGHSYDTIAHAIGYKNASSASLAVNRELARQRDENLEQFVQTQKKRYNYLLASVFSTAIDKNDDKQISALNAALSVMGRMEDLYGVNKLVNNDVQDKVVMIESADQDYAERLRDMSAKYEIEEPGSERDDELREQLMATEAGGWEDIDSMEVVDAEIIDDEDDDEDQTPDK